MKSPVRQGCPSILCFLLLSLFFTPHTVILPELSSPQLPFHVVVVQHLERNLLAVLYHSAYLADSVKVVRVPRKVVSFDFIDLY